MPKNNQKYLLDDDTFYLSLYLMGYPHGRKKALFFSDLASMKYKSMRKDDLLTCLVATKNLIDLELKNPTQEKSLLWKIATQNSFAQVNRFFKQHNFSEIKDIFTDNDFQIIVSEETQKILREANNEYLDNFINGELAGWQQNYLPFEDQKSLLIEKIKTYVNKYGSEVIFIDCDMPEGCKFFEIMFALQKMNYLKIKHIIGADETSNFFYKIVFLADEKIFPTDKLEKPTCEISKGFGFLKLGKKGKRIKISKIDSQRFKLVHFLMKPFKIAKTIDAAFEVIQTEHNKKVVSNGGAYLSVNEKIKALTTVIKDLQKIKEYTRVLKINIDKERKIIWLSYRK
jgi:hypothetical protein